MVLFKLYSERLLETLCWCSECTRIWTQYLPHSTVQWNDVGDLDSNEPFGFWEMAIERGKILGQEGRKYRKYEIDQKLGDSELFKHGKATRHFPLPHIFRKHSTQHTLSVFKLTGVYVITAGHNRRVDLTKKSLFTLLYQVHFPLWNIRLINRWWRCLRWRHSCCCCCCCYWNWGIIVGVWIVR